jgi:hypothetical protein
MCLGQLAVSEHLETAAFEQITFSELCTLPIASAAIPA